VVEALIDGVAAVHAIDKRILTAADIPVVRGRHSGICEGRGAVIDSESTTGLALALACVVRMLVIGDIGPRIPAGFFRIPHGTGECSGGLVVGVDISMR